MKKNKLGEKYWNERYQSANTPWELNVVSPPLKSYIDQLQDTNLKILVPGCGSGNEVKYLWQKGFKSLYVNDISDEAINRLSSKIPDFPSSHILKKDFFDIENKFDLILEQTFFCALEPQLRPAYVVKTNNLLRNNGKLVGLLFDFQLNDSGPPYGGNIKTYKNLFEKHYKISTLERSYNSIESRKNKELFFIFDKL